MLEYECYENEMLQFESWVPNRTDCCHFSDASGLIDRPRAACIRPSRRWAWDGPWAVTVPDGGVLATPELSGGGGWLYAREFGAVGEHPGPPLLADTVRRRCWVRRCRIVDRSPWTAVELPSVAVAVVTPSSVSSVAVGPRGVWIVTGRFQLYFRVGVTAHKPEGAEWAPVPAPPMPAGCVRVDGLPCIFMSSC